MSDQSELEDIISQCLQNHSQNEAEKQEETTKDLEDYFKEKKKDVPFKEFSQMSQEEKKEYLQYLYFKSKLANINNKEIAYIMLCSFLERGQSRTIMTIQKKLGFAPIEEEKTIGTWFFEDFNKKDDNEEFLEKLRKFNATFKPFQIKSQSSNNTSNQEQNKNSDEQKDQQISSSSTLDSIIAEEPKRYQKSTNTKIFQQSANIYDPNNQFEEDGYLTPDVEQYILDLQKKFGLVVDGYLTYEFYKLLNQEIKVKDPSFSILDKFLNQNQLKPKPVKILKLFKKSKPSDEDQSLSRQEGEEQVGGIKFNTKVHPVKKILGFKIMPDKSLKLLVDKRKESPEDSGVDSEDLALCLSIYLDQSLPHKDMSFSLDPWEETDPKGPYQKKIFYPDVHEKKKIFEGSKFGEIMFECDFLMKQMALGVQADSKTPFVYPESLSSKGFKRSSLFEDKEEEEQKKDCDWSRKWLICKQIDGLVDPNNNGVFIDSDVKVVIDARQMIQDSEGKLIDNPNQDTNHSSYKFAAKMTELYEDICKEYPCFEKLKKLYRAVAMANITYSITYYLFLILRWIAKSGVLVDVEKVKEIAQKQFEGQENFTNKINALSYEFVTQLPDQVTKKPIDAKELAIKALNHNNIEITDENIEMAIEQLAQKQGGSREFYETYTKTLSYRRSVFGGVEMKCEIKNVVKGENLNESFSDASTTYTSIDDERIKSITSEEDFIFSVKARCKVCQIELTPKEIVDSFEGQFYCHDHHPKNCYYCGYRIIEGAVYFQDNSQLYNAESFVGKKVYFHQDCSVIFQEKCLQQKNKKIQKDWASRSNANLIIQIQKYNQEVKTVKDIKLKKPKHFVCSNCHKVNQRNDTIICSVCGVANNPLAIVFLNQK